MLPMCACSCYEVFPPNGLGLLPALECRTVCTGAAPCAKHVLALVQPHSSLLPYTLPCMHDLCTSSADQHCCVRQLHRVFYSCIACMPTAPYAP